MRRLLLVALALSVAGCADAAKLPDLSQVEHVPFNERVVVDLPAGDVRVYVEVPEALPLDPAGEGIASGPSSPGPEQVVITPLEEDRRLPVRPPEASTLYTSETRGGQLLGTVEVPAAGRYEVRAALERPDPGSFVGFEPVG